MRIILTDLAPAENCVENAHEREFRLHSTQPSLCDSHLHCTDVTAKQQGLSAQQPVSWLKKLTHLLDALPCLCGCCLHLRPHHEAQSLHQGWRVQLVNGYGLGAHPHAGAGGPPEGLVPKEGHYCRRASGNQPYSHINNNGQA